MNGFVILMVTGLFSITATGQKSKNLFFADLYGKWKVKDWQYLEWVSPNDIDSAIVQTKRCETNGLIIIDSSGIQERENLCGLVKCNRYQFEKELVYYLRKIVSDKRGIDNHAREKYKWEDEDTDIVSREFINMIDPKCSENKITVIDTKCDCEWGGFTLKIYVLNRDEIALYSSADITILERIK
jgi:hypothetical protein